ncbi:MAG: F0F1 ATP synthase subunit A, partial [Coxiellaceae bacterium]|nr:F0F1 ATP synthase subunit A [Coxiellaceae bacterium]
MSASQGLTVSEYIQHHLTNLQFNLQTMQLGDGGGFWTLHLDTLFFSLGIGAFFLWFLVRVARKATPGVPGKLQNVVEVLIDFVDQQVKETFHGKSALVA